MNEKQKTWLYWSLIIANIISAIGGFAWWYGPQLLRTPWYLWVFTPPSPLYAFLFALVFSWMLLTKRQGGLFSFVASVGVAKYGIWTVASQIFLFIMNKNYVLSNYSLMIMMWLVVSHLIMFAESSLLLQRMRQIRWSWIVTAIVWFALNDYLDYVGFPGFGTTITYLPGGKTFYLIIAVLATLALPFLAMQYQKMSKI